MGGVCSCEETPLAPPPLPGTTDVVYEGYLRILGVGRDVDAAKLSSSWQRRYFILKANGELSYFKSGSSGVGVDPKGAVFLSSDFFVGDSLLHDHGFQISDLVATTWYMWADNDYLQVKWMTHIGTVLHMIDVESSKPAAPDGPPPTDAWNAKAAEEVEELCARSVTMKSNAISFRKSKQAAEVRESMRHWISQKSLGSLDGEDSSEWSVAKDSSCTSSVGVTRISQSGGSGVGLLSRMSGAKAARADRAMGRFDDVPRPSRLVAERLERQALFSLNENKEASSAQLLAQPSLTSTVEEEEDDDNDEALEAIKRARISCAGHAALHMEAEEAEEHAKQAEEEAAAAKAAKEVAAKAAAAAEDAAKRAAVEADAAAAKAAADATAAKVAEAAKQVAIEAKAEAEAARESEKTKVAELGTKEAEKARALHEATAKKAAEAAAEAEAEAALEAAEAKAAKDVAVAEARKAAEAVQRMLEEAEAEQAEAKKAAKAAAAKAEAAKAEAEAKAAQLAKAEAAKAEQVQVEVPLSPRSAALKVTAAPVGGGGGLDGGVAAVRTVKKLTALQQRALELEERQKKANEEMKANPFSKNFDPTAAKNRVKKGAEGYGKAVAGSETEARANKAQEWIEHEIGKLVEVLKEFGQENGATGEVHMTFGELFERYADISDTLVGILMRAKKRKRILFDSDMLFQGVHDHIVIRLMPV